MIVINDKAYYTELENLNCFYSNVTGLTVTCSEYSEDDSDFSEDNYSEDNRVDNTVFYIIKRKDNRYAIITQDIKWVLPKDVNGESNAIKESIKNVTDHINELEASTGKKISAKEFANEVIKYLNNAINKNSSSGKAVRVKKVYIDYPAYIQNLNAINDALHYSSLDGYTFYKYSQYDEELDKLIGVDGYMFSTNEPRPLEPDDNIIFPGPTNPVFLTPSVNHTSLVYPDNEYWHNDTPDLLKWLKWLDDNKRKIAFAKPLDMPTEIRSTSDFWKICGPEVYMERLNHVVTYASQLENISDYSFGILVENRPNDSSRISLAGGSQYGIPQPVTLVLYSAKYIKIPHDLEMDTLKDTWFDLTYSYAKRQESSWLASGRQLETDDRGITIGFLKSITEQEYLAHPPAIVITAEDAGHFGRYIQGDLNGTPLGAKQLNKDTYYYYNKLQRYEYSASWNVYSEILMPYDLFHLKGDSTSLYSVYAHGKQLKYRTRFNKSPVFTFPLFAGYFSHALRPTEGIIPGK